MVQTTIPVSQGASDVPSNEPVPLFTLRVSVDRLRAAGYTVRDAEKIAEVDHPETPDGVGITPRFMVGGHRAGDMIRAGNFPFSLTDGETPDGAGDDTADGSENVTTMAAHADMSVAEIIDALLENGGVEAAIELFERSNLTGDAVEFTAFALATYAKGWMAEQIITSLPRFSKLWVSNDQHGDDVRDHDRDDQDRQVKCATAREEAPEGTLYYQWTCRGELAIADDYTDLADALPERVGHGNAKATEVNKTLTYRCVDSKTIEDGRTYRCLWW